MSRSSAPPATSMEPWIDYDHVLAFEESLGMRFDYVLQVGDFSVWPDPGR